MEVDTPFNLFPLYVPPEPIRTKEVAAGVRSCQGSDLVGLRALARNVPVGNLTDRPNPHLYEVAFV